MIASAPLWSVLVVPAVLAAFAAAAVTGDALLAARAAGRPLRAAVAAGPLAEVPRLLAGQRRSTVASDALLWRPGGLAGPARRVLAAPGLPVVGVAGGRVRGGRGRFPTMEGLHLARVWV